MNPKIPVGDATHTTGEIWRVVSDQGKQIGELQTGLARLEQRFEGGVQQLSTQIQSLAQSMQHQNVLIDRASDAANKPTDVKGWLGLAFTLLVILGSTALLVVKPLQDNQSKLEGRVWEMAIEAAEARGRER